MPPNAGSWVGDVHVPTREQVTWAPEAGDLDILRHLADGQTVGVVARRVGLSERTVRRRLRTMADEAGVDTTIEVVVRAVRAGLI
jgi:DNA-binding CsgD family transcriptional regulator